MQRQNLVTRPGKELKILATRIADLRTMMSQIEDGRRNENLEEIEKLERRHKALDDGLRRLGRQRPDLRHGAQAEIEAGTDELTRWVAEHLRWVESSYRPDMRPKRHDTI